MRLILLASLLIIDLYSVKDFKKYSVKNIIDCYRIILGPVYIRRNSPVITYPGSYEFYFSLLPCCVYIKTIFSRSKNYNYVNHLKNYKISAIKCNVKYNQLCLFFSKLS